MGMTALARMTSTVAVTSISRRVKPRCACSDQFTVIRAFTTRAEIGLEPTRYLPPWIRTGALPVSVASRSKVAKVPLSVAPVLRLKVRLRLPSASGVPLQGAAVAGEEVPGGEALEGELGIQPGAAWCRW